MRYHALRTLLTILHYYGRKVNEQKAQTLRFSEVVFKNNYQHYVIMGSHHLQLTTLLRITSLSTFTNKHFFLFLISIW